jgi:hypothetical protein
MEGNIEKELIRCVLSNFFLVIRLCHDNLQNFNYLTTLTKFSAIIKYLTDL